METATLIEKLRAAIALLKTEHPAGADILLDNLLAPNAMLSYEVDGVKYSVDALARIEAAILRNYDGGMVLYITDGGKTVATIAPCEKASDLEAARRREEFLGYALSDQHAMLIESKQMDIGFLLWSTARALLVEKHAEVKIPHNNERYLLRMIMVFGERGVWAVPKMDFEPVFGEAGYITSFEYGTYLECRMGDCPPANPELALAFLKRPADLVDGSTEDVAWEVACCLHYLDPIIYKDWQALYASLVDKEHKRQAMEDEVRRQRHEESRKRKAPPTYGEDGKPNPAYQEYYGLTQEEFERRVTADAGADMIEGEEVYTELDATIQAKIDAKDNA